jgi:hypothetical protein
MAVLRSFPLRASRLGASKCRCPCWREYEKRFSRKGAKSAKNGTDGAEWQRRLFPEDALCDLGVLARAKAVVRRCHAQAKLGRAFPG